MKISSCSLALLSFVLFSIGNHNAFPCSNWSQIQLTSTHFQGFLTYLYHPLTDKPTTSTTLNKILTYDPYTDKPSTNSTSSSVSLTYDPYTDKSTNSSPDRLLFRYDPYTDKPTTSAQSRILFRYDPYTDKPTTATPYRAPLTYDPYTDKFSTSSPLKKPLTNDPFTDKSTTSSPRLETLIYNPFARKTTTSTRIKDILNFAYIPYTDRYTISTTPNPKYRNRYNVRHRFRNPIVTVTLAAMTTSHRESKKSLAQLEKTLPNFKFNDVYKGIKDPAYIETRLFSTPIVHLNITIPKVLLEGKVPRLASPYIIKITLARRLAPRSNTTLPNRGFLRIVGSPVNMLQEGNLAMIIGKIASQIGNAYNMSGKDVQGMRHVIVVGPGGQMMNRRATPPKVTTKLTSPPMMTARVRLRPNCTLPPITDRVIHFEDYIKYFELY